MWEMVAYTDVLGNPEDGWEVNNQTVMFDDLVIADDATDDDILDYLVNIGFLITKEGVAVEDNGDMIEISEDNGFPICRLMKVS